MQIKTITLTLVLLVTLLNAANAQELIIKSLSAAPMDLSASQYERKDLAGQPCGLVKVQLATMGAKFEGNIVGQTEYKTGEYWVYMTEGAYMLTVKLSGVLPLDINFRDYGIMGVTGKSTYKLILLMPQTAATIKEQKLIVNYTPADAMVLIDSRPYKGNGRVETDLALGSHTYIIAAEGYETAESSVKLNGGSPRTITENLVAMTRTKSVQQQTEAPTTEALAHLQKPTPIPVVNTQDANASTIANTSISHTVETFWVRGVSFNMVRVEGGTFIMGGHQITVPSYNIGETEVTQALWQAVMGSNPSKFKGSNKPVERVNWDKCQQFVQKLNQLTGRRFRLPTEVEWEYAAYGGNKSQRYKYSGSDDINKVAWYTETVDKKGSCDVKTKMANELGIYDMSGNVWEWCQDMYDKYSSPQANPKFDHVNRGGGWRDYADPCRVSYRRICASDYWLDSLGLRLAL